MDQQEPVGPNDEKLEFFIEMLAKKVAERGPEFEKKFKERQLKAQGPKPYLAFLDEGNEFNAYYKHRVILTFCIYSYFST